MISEKIITITKKQADLVALLDLRVVRLSAVGLAAGLHVIEALLGALLRLLAVVRVRDSSLCKYYQYICHDRELKNILRPRATFPGLDMAILVVVEKSLAERKLWGRETGVLRTESENMVPYMRWVGAIYTRAAATQSEASRKRGRRRH